MNFDGVVFVINCICISSNKHMFVFNQESLIQKGAGIEMSIANINWKIDTVVFYISIQKIDVTSVRAIHTQCSESNWVMTWITNIK